MGEIESAGVDQLGGTSATQPGEIFVEARLRRGGSPIFTLLSDYWYTGHALGYPGGMVRDSLSGRGRIRYISTDNPAAGAETAAEAVPTNAVWRVRSFQIQMAQGVTQTPRPALAFRNASAALVALVPLSADVAASTTVDCHWGLGLGDSVANNVTGGSMTAALSDMLLTAGFDVITSTQGIGAGSDYGVGILEVEEWIAV